MRIILAAGYRGLHYPVGKFQSGVKAMQAQDLTPRILVERAEILDQITRYYYNILNPVPESFLEFFTDDGELILGTRKRNIFGGTKPPE